MPVPSDHHSRKVKQERFLFFLAMAVSDKRGGGGILSYSTSMNFS